MNSDNSPAVPGSKIPLNKASTSMLAAGMGMAMTSTAQAAIVYNDIPDLVAENSGGFFIDINGDGFIDFDFAHFFSPGSGSCGYYCYPTPDFGYSYVLAANTDFYVNGATLGPVAAGSSIGAGTSFSQMAGIGYTYGAASGPFPGDATGYLGFVFAADPQLDENYYGWMRLFVDAETASVQLMDFAYESVAGKSIRAGAVPLPAASPLFAAALGALGVCSFRRRKRKLQ